MTSRRHYHLIGIGGIGMSGIAQLLARKGEIVSGSDIKESTTTQELRARGIAVFIGHATENLKDADFVVYSSAITESNPEMAEAKRRGIPIIRRAQALAQLMEDKTVITVAGSHGKTTTTSLVSFMLLEAGFMPTAAIGGILRNIAANTYFGEGKFFVAEADESDGSFLYYRPYYSIVTNIDREHLDYYKEFDKEVDAFGEFLQRTQSDGCVFACADDPYLQGLLNGYQGNYVLFGLRENPGAYARNIRFSGLTSVFECVYRGKPLGEFHLALGGMHNVSNALSVIALAMELGVSLQIVQKALATYQGAKRRLEVKFSDTKITVIDDYAHHPTELRATLAAARRLNCQRLIAVFQPHRYSRTQLLQDEFASSFGDADTVVITDIYAASEAPIPGVSAENLSALVRAQRVAKDTVFLHKEEIIPFILKTTKPGDIVLTLGAGDISKLCDDLVEELKRNR